MLGMYVHAPDLAEVGSFWNIHGVKAVLDSEKQIKTQFAFATTAGQYDADEWLKGADWTCLGHRYNQLHGPHFVKLWMKEFPENTRPQEIDPRKHGGYLAPLTGWGCTQAPPHGMFSCGVWFALPKFNAKDAQRLLTTKWLAVWRIEDKLTKKDRDLLKDNDWSLVGDTAQGATIWHTAEPLTSKNKHGARD